MNRFVLIAAAALSFLGPYVAHAQVVTAPTYQGQDGQTKEALGTFCVGSACTGGGGAGGATATGQTNTQAAPGSNSTTATGVQGVDGGKAIAVTSAQLPAATSTPADGQANGAGIIVRSLNQVWSGTAWSRTPGDSNGSYFQGNVPSGGTDSGNPAKIGGRASSSAPTSVSSGQRVDAWYGLTGSAASFLTAVNGTAIGVNSPSDGASVGPSLDTRSFPMNWNGSGYDRSRGDATGLFNVDTPTAAATNAIVPNTALGATSLVVKATAGNFYGATLVAGTVAGNLIIANLSAVPAGGTALTAAQVLYCVPVAANGVGTAGNLTIPDRATTGIVVLFSTSCSTYTAVGTAAVHIRARGM